MEPDVTHYLWVTPIGENFLLDCLQPTTNNIAFASQNLFRHERLYSIYDKEMLAIMHALAKFRQYLVGIRFRVKIDHNSLRFFLEQK